MPGTGQRVARAAARVVGPGGLAAAIAASPVLFLWPLLHADRITYLVDNRLPHRQRYQLLALVVASIAAAAVVVALLHRRALRRGSPPSLRETLIAFDLRLLGLLALPPLTLLFVPGIEVDAPVAVLLASAVATGLIAVWVYHLPPVRAARATGVTGWLPLVLVVAAAAAWAVLMAHWAITQHHALGTSSSDLAIYDNILWQSSHGVPLGLSYSPSGYHTFAHADPILVLLAPLYRIDPRAETLLVLQAVWVASGVLPIYLLARRLLGDGAAAAVPALVWLLHPALHGATLYHFHSITLIAPLLPWAILLLEIGALRAYFVVLALLLLCREDVALLACGLGLWAALTGRVRTGLATIVVALAYLAAVKFLLMPDPTLLIDDLPGSRGFSRYYQDLIPYRHEGSLGIAITALINPVFVVEQVVRPVKLIYLALLFQPLLFLPLLLRRGWALLGYGLAFSLLASRSSVYSIHFQYSVVLVPLAIAAVPLVLGGERFSALADRLRLDAGRVRRAALVGLLASSALVTLRFGALVDNESFHAGYEPFERRLDAEQEARYQWLRAAIDAIPADASVAHTDRLGPHVSNRRHVYLLSSGIDVDYLLVENDRGKRALDHEREQRIYAALSGGGAYRLVDRRGDLELWQRVAGAPFPDLQAVLAAP